MEGRGSRVEGEKAKEQVVSESDVDESDEKMKVVLGGSNASGMPNSILCASNDSVFLITPPSFPPNSLGKVIAALADVDEEKM
jgi:hypothetical protein